MKYEALNSPWDGIWSRNGASSSFSQLLLRMQSQFVFVTSYQAHIYLIEVTSLAEVAEKRHFADQGRDTRSRMITIRDKYILLYL